MQIQKKHWIKTAIVIAACALTISPLWRGSADEIPAPVMTITRTNTDLYIKITNGVGTANYELYRRPLFDVAYPWTLHIVGAQGQTNFTATMGVETASFFRMAIGSDWDQDGVTNAIDGDPIDAAVGILSITIDSPANGTTFD